MKEDANAMSIQSREASGAETAVDLRGVTKRFGTFTAVDNLSLAIQEGEFFSLLGPSGCGKTTTLRMIAGFDLPSAGEIYLRGKAVGQLPPFKRNVNTVFQSYALFPHLTVQQNVAFGLEMKRVGKTEIERRVGEALEMVRLPDVGHRKPHQLSGGQKQRIALARALINRPEVLLLDEPLGALDLKLRKAMQLELKELQRRLGITFIFVTHDQEEALIMSDRIGVMNEGLLLQVGPPQEIYDRPTSRFVADFIGETNFLPCKATAVGDEFATVVVGGNLTMQAVAQGSVAVGQELTLTIRPEKIHIHHPDEQISGESVYDGRILETVFIGTDTRFNVELADGVRLEVREQNVNIALERFGVGQAVAVSWQPRSAQLLSE
jgi:spermidine/putrescine transport system ATP-binding protein